MTVYMITAVVLIIFAWIVLPWIARGRAEMVLYARLHQSRFFGAAEALVKDPNTEDVVLKMIGLMTDSIENRRLIMLVVLDAARGFVRDGRRDQTGFARNVLMYLDGMNADSQRDCAVAVLSYVLAITYTNFFFGGFARRFMLYGIPQPQIIFDEQPAATDFDALGTEVQQLSDWSDIPTNARLSNSVKAICADAMGRLAV